MTSDNCLRVNYSPLGTTLDRTRCYYYLNSSLELAGLEVAGQTVTLCYVAYRYGYQYRYVYFCGHSYHVGPEQHLTHLHTVDSAVTRAVANRYLGVQMDYYLNLEL
eukprot:scaffold654892_cov79-Prasinocladus_malaysianus.AAC.1